jgi:ADP-ribosylglycohydrolase
MRCLPTALARAHSAQRAAETRSISAITHDDVLCVEACVVYNEIVAGLLASADPELTLRIALAGCANADVADAVKLGQCLDLAALGERGDAGVPHGNQGFVLDSLSLAVADLLDPRPFEEILIDVVSLGGDADTTGAVTGALVGARDGDGGIPSRWLQPLWLRTEFELAATWLIPLRDPAADASAPARDPQI